MSLIKELVSEFGLGEGDLRRIIITAPLRYKVYPIEKRHGGVRLIAQPSSELKAIQRYIVATKLSSLPVHQSATGYVSGRNIFANADAHRKNRVLLKLDFKEFFPSLRVGDWLKYIRGRKQKKILEADLALYSNILFWGKKTRLPICLSIGAPSSPVLSNILMYNLDIQFSKIAKDLEVTYTRYADDITASAQRLESVVGFEEAISKVIAATRSPRLQFNNSKRGVYFRGQKRMVTGLVITPDEKISVGRERKRLISSMLHHVSVGQIDAASMGHLKGLLGFCLANEPNFVDRMRLKYGNEVLDRALRFEVPAKLFVASKQQ